MEPDTRAPQDWEVLLAESGAAGQRLDLWLAERLGPEISRSRVKSMIEAGHVQLNGKPSEPSRRLMAGDRVEWRQPEADDPVPLPEDISLDILYEDEHLIVINKPPGLVVHPGAGNPSGTLVNALIYHCGDTLSGIGGVKRPGIVHRLDKDTSGVMVVAKNDAAHRHLAAAFADHGRHGDLERRYLALVWGVPSRRSGTIDAPLGRANADRTRRAVVAETRADARPAVTRYRVIETYGDASGGSDVASLVECLLETGRTHQVRVHMAHIGHPLIGDPLYGQGFRTKAQKLPDAVRQVIADFRRQALHAGVLAFRHPVSGMEMRFKAPPPADFARLISAFRTI